MYIATVVVDLIIHLEASLLMSTRTLATVVAVMFFLLDMVLLQYHRV
jgi:hypothetical protein